MIIHSFFTRSIYPLRKLYVHFFFFICTKNIRNRPLWFSRDANRTCHKRVMGINRKLVENSVLLIARVLAPIISYWSFGTAYPFSYPRFSLISRIPRVIRSIIKRMQRESRREFPVPADYFCVYIQQHVYS